MNKWATVPILLWQTLDNHKIDVEMFLSSKCDLFNSFTCLKESSYEPQMTHESIDNLGVTSPLLVFFLDIFQNI